METAEMGKVVVSIKLENFVDAENANRGLISPTEIRRAEADDAVVDTGAYGMLLPKRMVEQLGLRRLRTQPTSTLGGRVIVGVYSAVRFTIMDRDGICDVAEIPDEFQPIIGQIPLEMLDLVVDCKRQQVTGNPAHGGAWIMEML